MRHSVSDAYCSCQYEAYGEKTRKSLARLNEAVIDYDLVEELISYITTRRALVQCWCLCRASERRVRSFGALLLLLIRHS